MALPAYDTEKHHVGLGPDGSEIGLIVAGAYSKAFKRDVSDELQGVHYGSDSFFNQPGVSSWSMDDFTGGAFQQVWGRDVRMFSSCENLLPAQFDRSLRTVPPFQPIGDAGAAYGSPLCSFAHGGYFVTLFPTALYLVNMTTHAVSAVALTTGLESFTHAVYDRRSGYVLATFTNGSGPGVAPLNPLTGALHGGGAIQPGAANNEGDFTGIDCDGDRLVVSSADSVWTVEMTTTPALIGSDWTRVGRLPAPYVASTWLGQQLYILCGGSDKQTSIVAFDGVQVLPVTELPFNFVGQSIAAYAGRVYVGGSGRDINDSHSYAELHEITGSSVRLIKTFAPEVRSGRYSAPASIHSLCAYEGLLFFGKTGSGLIAYDVTTDALYGGQMFDNVQGAFSDRRLLTLVSARGRLWGWMYVGNNANFHGPWFGAVSGDSVNSSFAGKLITSDFGPELDRLKKWKAMRLLTRGDTVDPTLEASIDGGASWTSCAQTAEVTAGGGTLRTYDLSGVAVSHAIRFRITLSRASSSTSFAELVSFSASFQLVDSDDVHPDGRDKLAWTFAVAGVETVELVDGDVLVQRLSELKAQLWTWARDRTELSLVDQDGSAYTVKIDTMRETQPVILPPVGYNDPLAGGQGVVPAREAFYAVTLIEA